VVWLLSLINVLFDEDLVDLGRAAQWVNGVDNVRSVASHYTPQTAEEICGISAEVTVRVARELAAAPAAAVYGRIGAHTVAFGTLTSWATDVLNVLTGNFDRPGGVMFCSSPTTKLGGKPGGRGFQTGRWQGRASGRGEVLGELPAATLAQEIETPGEGQIKALVVVACNPVRSFPNSQRLDAAMADLDLLVSVDPYINATSRHAHVILPPLSALERSHYDMTFERTMIRAFAKYSPAVFPTDRPDEPEILTRLSLVLGGQGAQADPADTHITALTQMVDREVGSDASPIAGRDVAEILAELDQWSWAEQIVDFRLRVGRYGDAFGANADGLTLRRLVDEFPHGRDYGHLVERFPEATKTTSGQVDLFPEIVANDIGRLRDADFRRDGLVLVGRRHLRSCNTWMHNVNVLVKGKERCTLQVHPSDAKTYGLSQGGTALVSSAVGQVRAPVEVTEAVMPGVVSLPFGWGYDTPGIKTQVAQSRPGVNANILTDDKPLDEPSGTSVLNAIPVAVVSA